MIILPKTVFFEFVGDKLLRFRITNMFKKILEKLSNFSSQKINKIDLEDLDRQDLSRFSEQDIILESSEQIQEYLPDVLGQALARTWIDKRFLEAFQDYPLEIMERGGVYLPDHISIEFLKGQKTRPKVIVYENNGRIRKKLLELKLIMVAEE